jgi:FkbM family methyltransferase
MLAEHDVLSVGPNFRARIHYAAIRLVKVVTVPVQHRGAGMLIRGLARLFGHEGYVIIEPTPGARLKIGLYDGYWLGLLMRDPAYEPETAAMLDLLLDEHTLFVDCGANIGWWSVIAARRIGQTGHVIAIEASSRVFSRLRENAVLNNGSFVPLHAAIWSTSGVPLLIAADDARHAWASVDPGIRSILHARGFHDETVGSISIDDAIRGVERRSMTRLVLKLDVEGAELQAIQGATAAIEGDAAVVYEDHGRDTSNAISEALLAMGMDIFAWGSDALPRQLRDGSAISKWKASKRRGYNFVACRPSTSSHQLVRSACQRAA